MQPEATYKLTGGARNPLTQAAFCVTRTQPGGVTFTTRCKLLSEAVKRVLPMIYEYADIPSLLPHLVSQDFLELSDEHSQLTKKWEEGKKREAITLLLEMLQRKGPDWSEGLLIALEKSTAHRGHSCIIQELKTTVDCLQNKVNKLPMFLQQQKSHSLVGCCLCNNQDEVTVKKEVERYCELPESLAKCKIRASQEDFVEVSCECGCTKCCKEIEKLRGDKRMLETSVKRYHSALLAVKLKISEVENEQ